MKSILILKGGTHTSMTIEDVIFDKSNSQPSKHGSTGQLLFTTMSSAGIPLRNSVQFTLKRVQVL